MARSRSRRRMQPHERALVPLELRLALVRVRDLYEEMERRYAQWVFARAEQLGWRAIAFEEVADSERVEPFKGWGIQQVILWEGTLCLGVLAPKWRWLLVGMEGVDEGRKGIASLRELPKGLGASLSRLERDTERAIRGAQRLARRYGWVLKGNRGGWELEPIEGDSALMPCQPFWQGECVKVRMDGVSPLRVGTRALVVGWLGIEAPKRGSGVRLVVEVELNGDRAYLKPEWIEKSGLVPTQEVTHPLWGVGEVLGREVGDWRYRVSFPCGVKLLSPLEVREITQKESLPSLEGIEGKQLELILG